MRKREEPGNGNWEAVFKDKELDIAKEGLIQHYEYTIELAWKVMKDYLNFQGNYSIHGSRDAIQAFFSMELIIDGELWVEMLKSRNKTSHTYNEEIANEIFLSIVNKYSLALMEFEKTMKALEK